MDLREWPLVEIGAFDATRVVLFSAIDGVSRGIGDVVVAVETDFGKFIADGTRVIYGRGRSMFMVDGLKKDTIVANRNVGRV